MVGITTSNTISTSFYEFSSSFIHYMCENLKNKRLTTMESNFSPLYETNSLSNNNNNDNNSDHSSTSRSIVDLSYVLHVLLSAW